MILVAKLIPCKKVSLELFIFCLCDIDCYEIVYIGLMVFYLACFLQHAIWKEKVVHCWILKCFKEMIFGAPVWIFVKGTLLLAFFFVHTETQFAHKPIFVVNSERINEKTGSTVLFEINAIMVTSRKYANKRWSTTFRVIFTSFLVHTCTLPWNI